MKLITITLKYENEVPPVSLGSQINGAEVVAASMGDAIGRAFELGDALSQYDEEHHLLVASID